MVSNCNPYTNVVKTTIHTMATTLNCSSSDVGGGSGATKTIKITVCGQPNYQAHQIHDALCTKKSTLHIC